MNLEEKIASVNKLERIDSSIESCIKILEQELNKRKVEDPTEIVIYSDLRHSLDCFKVDFNIMKNKK